MSEEPNQEKPHPFVRFRDIIPQERMSTLKIAIIGAGGIGAPTALALAKMGVHRLEIWDPDVVNDENIGPQMYGPRTVGQFKVNALKNFLRGQAPWCEVTVHQALFTPDDVADADVLIMALDSLQARKDVWSTVDPDRIGLVVDPRMGAEVLTVHSVIPKDDAQWFESTMEGVAVEAKCTAKSTFHCGLVAGAYAAREVKAWVVGERSLVEYTIDLRYLSPMMGMNQEQRLEVHNAQEDAA
jgi:molybdopterin/thiamine biosynthesis adenylyltransferase